MPARRRQNHPDWEANSLRVTVFPNTPFLGTPNDLKPELADLMMNQRASVMGETVFEGNYRNNKISLMFLPFRFDLIINRLPAMPSIQGATIYNIGTFEEAIACFNPIIEAWLQKLQDINIKRIALGAELFKSVESPETGYQELSHYLPFTVDRHVYSDFRLQINKPQQSEIIQDLLLNRLVIFDVPKLSLQVNTGDASLNYNTPPTFYRHMVIDISTPLEYGTEIPHNQISPLINELIELSKGVSIRGFRENGRQR